MGLLLDISPRILEKVLYFASYIVINPGDCPLTKNQILTEKEYRDMREKYEDDFQAGMGAEAVKKLLCTVGLNDEESQRKLELLEKIDAAHAHDMAADPEVLAEYESLNGLTRLSEHLRAELKNAPDPKPGAKTGS